MPDNNDVLDRIGRAKYFTALDLASGYHQIEMDPNDKLETAFTALVHWYAVWSHKRSSNVSKSDV